LGKLPIKPSGVCVFGGCRFADPIVSLPPFQLARGLTLKIFRLTSTYMELSIRANGVGSCVVRLSMSYSNTDA
jgi:hypothetical protein